MGALTVCGLGMADVGGTVGKWMSCCLRHDIAGLSSLPVALVVAELAPRLRHATLAMADRLDVGRSNANELHSELRVVGCGGGSFG